MSKAGIQAPVAVVGAGPLGVTVANLLGCYGVEALVIDRDKDIVDYPDHRPVQRSSRLLRPLSPAEQKPLER